MSGQHSDPLRVVTFNTDTDRTEDVSHANAQEILRRLDLEGRSAPAALLPQPAADVAANVYGPVGLRELLRRGSGLQSFPGFPKLRFGRVEILG